MSEGFIHYIPPWDVAKQSWDDYIKEQRLAVEYSLNLAYSHAHTARKATRVAEQILRSHRVSSPFLPPKRGNLSQPRTSPQSCSPANCSQADSCAG